MSLIISLKATMSANFIVDIDNIEQATDDSPRDYKELYDAVSYNGDFLTDYVIPAFREMVNAEDMMLETIGDGCGRKTINTDAVWEDYVDDEFIAEMKHDELVADLHRAADNGDYYNVARIAALLSGQEIKQPWE